MTKKDLKSVYLQLKENPFCIDCGSSECRVEDTTEGFTITCTKCNYKLPVFKPKDKTLYQERKKP